MLGSGVVLLIIIGLIVHGWSRSATIRTQLAPHSQLSDRELTGVVFSVAGYDDPELVEDGPLGGAAIIDKGG